MIGDIRTRHDDWFRDIATRKLTGRFGLDAQAARGIVWHWSPRECCTFCELKTESETNDFARRKITGC